MASFTKEEILDQIPDDNHRDLGVKYIFEKMNLDITKVKPEDLKRVRSAVSALRTKRNEKFAASCRNNDQFKNINSKWLKGIFKVPTLLHFHLLKLLYKNHLKLLYKNHVLLQTVAVQVCYSVKNLYGFSDERLLQ